MIIDEPVYLQHYGVKGMKIMLNDLSIFTKWNSIRCLVNALGVGDTIWVG